MRVTSARVLRVLLKLAVVCVGFGLAMIGLHAPVVLLVTVVGLAWQKARRVAASGWSHGTAKLSTLNDLIRNGMLGPDGLILGTTIMPRPSFWQGLSALCSRRTPADRACHLFLSALGGSRWAGDRMIRLSHFTHLATFAPTGRGKGISVLVPNLRSYPHSCVVTDPKGELYELTSWIRHHRLGNRIIRLDPHGVCGPEVPASDRFNPLDCIDDKADDFLDQCRDLADMMIMQTGKEPDPYWNESARTVLTAFIAFVCACEDKREKRNLDTVRDLVSSRGSYTKALEVMQQVDTHGGVIQRLGHMMTWHVDRELGSVLANVQRHTEAFDSPVVARNFASSTFDPRCLRTGRVTIYLCLPHDKLDTLAPIMRVWIGMILRTITRGPKPSERNPVLFFLDEAAHLGKIRVLENAVTLMRGMGIRLWFFFQSVHQLQECYGEKAKVILDNIDTQQYFALNDVDNAEAVSKRIGDTTISVASHGQNSGDSQQYGEGGQRSSSTSSGGSITYSDTGRRLLKPEELMVLPENVALIFHRNLPVITARLLTYFNHPAFRGGGTGNEAGLELGPKATEMAVCLLLASVVFAAITAATLAPFDLRPDRPAVYEWPVESGWPDSSAGFEFPPLPGWPSPP